MLYRGDRSASSQVCNRFWGCSPPFPLACLETSDVLDNVFKPKSAVEPRIYSCMHPRATLYRINKICRGMYALSFLTVKHMGK